MEINSFNPSYNTSFSGRKVPRFLYHITSKENYQNILKDGALKPHLDSDKVLSGIFMFDMQNFAKAWRDMNKRDIRKNLLRFISRKSNDIVVLKISTENFIKDKIKIRSQNLVENLLITEDKIKKIIKERPYLNIAMPNMEYLKNGVGTDKINLLKQKRQAIEYVYGTNISTNNITKIGELNFLDCVKNKMGIRKALHTLFKGQPEINAIDR